MNSTTDLYLPLMEQLYATDDLKSASVHLSFLIRPRQAHAGVTFNRGEDSGRRPRSRPDSADSVGGQVRPARAGVC